MTYVTIRSLSGQFVHSLISNVELTAGIIVCCMPTTTAVLKRFKPPITSIISSYKKYPLLSATDRGAMKHHELGSVTNFRPTHRDQSYESSSEVANDLRDPFTNVENRRSEWPSKYERVPLSPLQTQGLMK